MRTASRLCLRWALAPLFLGWLIPALASGQYRDEYGGIRQTVARISFVEGAVSFSRGDWPNNWQPADRNVPMTIGDRIYTGNRSRVELQVHGGDFIRLGAQTDLVALNLTDDTKQFSVRSGVASFQIRRLSEDEIFEIDTPNAAITIDRPGEFRVDVDWDGNTRVGVRLGRATVAAGGGQVALQAGDEMDVDGIERPRYDVIALGRADGWDRWVQWREDRISRARSYQYVSADIVGVDDLDEYGRWDDIPEYGRVWTPLSVAVDWAPYRVGHWIWQDPWGWTWVSAEPWGWAPYHYGRWVVFSSRWYWVPVASRVTYVTYSPALVAFVGGGPGWSASVAFGGGDFVGWFPLGPRDPLVPWWSRRSVNVNVTNVTYVNRTYVTVVNQNTFVSGGIVANSVVRDPAVVRQVVVAPIARGPLPLVPTEASLRVAARMDLPAAPRPPAQVLERAVVARVAPPPAPPSFQAKLGVIRESRGAPVAPAEAAQISIQDRGRAEASAPVRPVVAREGQITLAPRGRAAESVSAARPEPVTEAPLRGRPLATSERPVAPAPVTADSVSPSSRAREGAAPVSPGAREIAPRSEPAPPDRGRESNERVAPPPQSEPGESWRSRERPAQVAPRNAPPREMQEQPQPRRERSREVQPAPPPTPIPENERAVQPRGRENVAPARERARPERQAPSSEERPAPEKRRERPTPPPQENPSAGESREAPHQEERQAPERKRGRPTPSAEDNPSAEQPREAPHQKERPAPERRRARPTPSAEENPSADQPGGAPSEPQAPPPDRSRERSGHE